MTNDADEIVHRFVQLFAARDDVYGAWNGRCVRDRLTVEHYIRHLDSLAERDWIGVYPFTPYGVAWGCVDLDGKDFRVQPGSDEWDWHAMLELAFDLQTLLAVKDVHAHIERTRNGYHLWVFPEGQLAPATLMRRTLMAACQAKGYNPKEVNPKQEELPPGAVGNYVRLPYYGALSRARGEQPDRYFITEMGTPMELTHFLETARRTSVVALSSVAKLWTPPVIEHEVDPTVDLDDDELRAVLNVVPMIAFKIWKDGPLPGNDRSNTLARLVHELAKGGIQPTSAFQILRSADRRWGKFAGRADCDEQLMQIVERVYAQHGDVS